MNTRKRVQSIIIVALTLVASVMQASDFDRLTLVKTDGSRVSFSVNGLKITYDDFVHARITNDEGVGSIALAELDYMYFDNEGNAFLPGDVNSDGEANIADVNVLIDIILNGTTDAVMAVRADINGDGEVSVADVNVVIGLILGL